MDDFLLLHHHYIIITSSLHHNDTFYLRPKNLIIFFCFLQGPRWRVVLVTNSMENLIEPLLKLCIVVNWQSVNNNNNNNNNNKDIMQLDDGIAWGRVLHRNIYSALKVCFFTWSYISKKCVCLLLLNLPHSPLIYSRTIS